MKRIYLDNASTTPLDKRVFESMKPYLLENYGNPGSLHTLGLYAKKAMDNSRRKIFNILGCKENEIIFTGSGTESINLAIKGILSSKNKGKHIITQKTEHHAVLDTCKFLEKEGFKVTYLDVDAYGLVDLDELKKAIKKDTILISIMYANNEIGTIQPIKEISKICKEKKVLFHTDACQAAEYLEMDVKKLGVDLMTINGSKIYGPKGIGALYVKEGIKLTPIIYGGGQERGLRSGTENVANIVGFAKALEIAIKEKNLEVERLTLLRDRMIKGILEKIPESFLNGHPTKRLPNNVHISIPKIDGEAVMVYLDREGIYVSTGSACTSRNSGPSHVMLAIGKSSEAAEGSIRFSLGKHTKKSDVDFTIKILTKTIKKLKGFVR